MAYTKTGQGSEKNKRKPHESWPFLALVSGAVVCAGVYCREKGCAPSVLLYDCLLTFLAFLTVWIYWLKAYRQDRLSYDNGEHPCRFWACAGMGTLASFGMCFLPAGSWFSPVGYLLLTLFGNAGLGIVGGTALLLIPGLLREISLDRFAAQFVAGVLTALAFQRYNGEKKLAVPAVKSLLILALSLSLPVLFCEGGGGELWEQALAGVLLEAVFFGVILLYFSMTVLLRNRKKYARLLDTEGELLKGFRERSRLDYLKSMHTAYFCEEIAGRLGWSGDMMKCAAYYYKWGNDLPELIRSQKFPSRCARILTDYFDSEMADIPRVHLRETAALVCADVVLGTMIYLVNSGAELPKYDVIIDAIFERMHRKGTFDKCEISGRELCAIKKIFKEETYYYDTLRGR